MMKMNVRSGGRWVFAVVVLAAGIVLPGCGKSEVHKPVYPARGVVLFRGQPAAYANLLLIPVDDPNPNALRPRAVTQADGSFELGTYLPNDGAPVGEYAVSLRWRGPKRPVAGETLASTAVDAKSIGAEPADYLRDKYSDPKTSGITIRIESQPNTVPSIVLN